jgi:hypothetical protein
VAERGRVCEPGLCLRSVHGSVHARDEPMLEQRGSNVRVERTVGHGGSVRVLGVRGRSLFGSLCSGSDAVLEHGERGSNVLAERAVGDSGGVYESGVRLGCVLGSLRAGSEAVQQPHTADLRR